jgi:tRNA nucleotidyltransferase (CCA-adding enzyme)|tara:strand:+ start:1197 stop:2435 length:1239 start_codon:yes stop_codon:yes gene_type:complete
MKKILLEAIEDIKPGKSYQKEILAKADDIIKTINKSLKNTKTILGGSGAKGTSLKTFDADIFVKFNYLKHKNTKSISDILEKFLKKHYKITRLHGSRDYFQIKQKKFTFEIVPILEIKKAEQAQNITDISPLHSTFVKKHRNLKNEIRLTKQFFKAAKVYGAESHIKGFSGYVCEILTIHYKSFHRLIKATTKWKANTVIDVKDYYKGKDVFMELNKSKLVSPLIVIDPVQKSRNAAAALDNEKFEVIKHRAQEFLKNPSKSFFEITVLTEHDIRKKFRKDNIAILKAKPLNKKEDVAGAKMLKAFHYIENNLIFHKFKIKESDMLWHYKNSSFFYYVLEKDNLSKTIELSGPPLNVKSHVKVFKKKHKDTFIKQKRIFAKEKRKFTSSKSLLKYLIKTPNIKDNVSSIRVL